MGASVDVSGFQGAMNAAAQYVGAGKLTRAAVEGELGKVLQRAVDYTHAPDEEEFAQIKEYGLRRKFNTYAGGAIGSQARRITPRISVGPRTGNIWWIDEGRKGSQTPYLMNGGPRKHWGDRYARFQAENNDRLADLATELQETLPKILAARGMSKQSWWQIGQMLNISIPGVPAWVRQAVDSRRPGFEYGTGTCEDSADRLVFTLANSMPTLIAPQKSRDGLEGANILQRAFDSRDKAIMTGIEKGVFDDLKAALNRFPGISVLMR